MQRARRMAVGLALVLAAAATAQTPTLVPAKVPVLVELFTSEGCSSCPPADRLLAKLNGTVTPSGQQILALSEHVTYWNRLGWVDPFSQELFSERQNTYAENDHLEEVFTPQVVVNGTLSALGSDEHAVLDVVESQVRPLPLTITVLSAVPNGATLSVVFVVEGNVPAKAADVYAALTDDSDTATVMRGENAGRTLTHVSVVRSLGRVGMLKAGEQTLLSLPLPPSTGPQVQSGGGRHLVLFAQVAGQGQVLGIVSEPLTGAIPTPTALRTVRRVVH